MTTGAAQEVDALWQKWSHTHQSWSRSQSMSRKSFECAINEYRALSPAQGWVSVKDRLPANEQEVLLYHNLGDVERPEVPHAIDVATYINGEWIFPWDRGLNPAPRWPQYWMPLPSPPSPASPQTEGEDGKYHLSPDEQRVLKKALLAGSKLHPGSPSHPASEPNRADTSSPVEQMDIPAMLRAEEVADVRSIPDDHPEKTCEKCGGPNITWFAPSPLWNAYASEHSVLCPICFTRMAQHAGLDITAWEIKPEFYSEVAPPADTLPERWMVDYEHGEDEPQHAVLSWLSSDPTKGLPDAGETLVRLSDYDAIRQSAARLRGELAEARAGIKHIQDTDLLAKAGIRQEAEIAELQQKVAAFTLDIEELQRQLAEREKELAGMREIASLAICSIGSFDKSLQNYYDSKLSAASQGAGKS